MKSTVLMFVMMFVVSTASSQEATPDTWSKNRSTLHKDDRKETAHADVRSRETKRVNAEAYEFKPLKSVK